jgi:hypothetical protein
MARWSLTFDEELRALWLGFLFFFLILAGYYITKPIRIALAERFAWMFTATLVAMLIANGAFAATVARCLGENSFRLPTDFHRRVRSFHRHAKSARAEQV